ncbi:hypothetical protein COOONC_25943 [Cooperia oncophora]
MFNNGEKPWPDDEPKRIATHIRKGRMPAMPPSTPPQVVQMTANIWNISPEARPSMDDLCKQLRALNKTDFKVVNSIVHFNEVHSPL